MRKPVFAALLLVILALPAFAEKVIVLGFDGVDARYTERWMNEGKLPNMARLRESGTFRPLRPTVPAQTPVSWSTFSTGIDPGRTGIFDFLRRDPKTYLPVFAAFDETKEPLGLGERNPIAAAGIVLVVIGIVGLLLLRRSRVAGIIVIVIAAAGAAGAFAATKKYIPTSRPGVINRRQGIPFWEAAATAGKKTTVVHVPVTFPATDFHDGHLLSGLGVPDMSGRVGKPFYFTSELDFHRSGANEFSIDVVQLEDNKGVIDTTIQGPPNKLFNDPPYISIPMKITVAGDRNSITIEESGQRVTLKAGEWSGWTEFVFPFNPLIKLKGISRFHLVSVQPEVKLYLSPINFDPRNLPPGFRISTPAKWAPELAKNQGLYKTLGWQIDTWAISEGFADEQMFWDDMNFTVTQSRKMFNSFLENGNDDLLVQCFEFPDRVGHVFWRFMDPQHPAYDASLAGKWGDALLKSYQLMDAIVGDAMKAADKNHAALIVLSDHGFASFRKSVNYNTWLVMNGYMVLKTGVQVKDRNVEMLFDQGQFWENVDWSKTRAYAMGLGELYINLQGREAHGIVQPGAEYDALKKELQSRLVVMQDPENGEHPVRRVIAREDVYRQFDPNMIPDLFITNNDGYRVSWQTSLGGIPKNLLDPNKQVWSGDHCSVDPEIVKGIFFYNRKLATGRPPYIADVYPTVLGLMGVKAPYALDGVELK
ncbi:MAG TPA: alkaline phosphatase family protein [Thermoanaerobaculia bacterium]|nr:alkaline phosphatase family protein [Thermoanaerobaculia bacterium]